MPTPQNGLPRHLRNVTLDDYEVAGKYGDPDALRAAQRYVDSLDDNLDKAVGQLFVGKPGGGKTLLAAAVFNAVEAAGHSVFFIPLENYNKTLQRMFKLERIWEKFEDPEALQEWREKDDKLIAIRNRYDFVVVDDVGKEHTTASEFIEDEFDFLLRHRHARGLTTTLTSNIPTSDWSQSYSPSMRSFVYEACEVVPVDTADYRSRRS